MNFKDKKGSISIFVLVALLFMASVLLLMFASSINKSKVVKEQFNTISEIYTYDDVDAYNKAYTELREKNKKKINATNEGEEDTSILKLTKTYADNIISLKLYGVTAETTISIEIKNEDVTEPLRIEVPLINPITDANIELRKDGISINNISYEEAVGIALENLRTLEDYTEIKVNMTEDMSLSKIEVDYVGYTLGTEEVQ